MICKGCLGSLRDSYISKNLCGHCMYLMCGFTLYKHECGGITWLFILSVPKCIHRPVKICNSGNLWYYDLLVYAARTKCLVVTLVLDV